MSERRIRNNKRKRQLQLKRKGFFFLISLIFAIAISSMFFGISAKASDSEETASYKYYTSIMIQEGDSLWSLAEKNCDKNFKSKMAYIEEIKEINGLSDEKLISGQYLIIPYYSVEYIG